MSKLHIILGIVLLVSFSGCFKVSYTIEFGGQDEPTTQDITPGYYYRAPTYFVK